MTALDGRGSTVRSWTGGPQRRENSVTVPTRTLTRAEHEVADPEPRAAVSEPLYWGFAVRGSHQRRISTKAAIRRTRPAVQPKMPPETISERPATTATANRSVRRSGCTTADRSPAEADGPTPLSLRPAQPCGCCALRSRRLDIGRSRCRPKEMPKPATLGSEELWATGFDPQSLSRPELWRQLVRSGRV
jgi:hypothetical protein